MVQEVLIDGVSSEQFQELFFDVPGIEINELRTGRALLTIDNSMIQDNTILHFIECAGYRTSTMHQLE